MSVGLYNFMQKPAKDRVIEDRAPHAITSLAPANLSLSMVNPLLDIRKTRDQKQADL